MQLAGSIVGCTVICEALIMSYCYAEAILQLYDLAVDVFVISIVLFYLLNIIFKFYLEILMIQRRVKISFLHRGIKSYSADIHRDKHYWIYNLSH